MRRRLSQVPTVTAAHVVVFTEKHGTAYYSGAKGFLAVARRVFDERDKAADWWGYPKGPPTPPTPPPAVPDGVTLDPQLQEVVRARTADYPHKLAAYQEWAHEFDLLTRARAGDDQAAAEFLVSRQEHEYEGFTVEPLVVPG